MKLYDRQGTPNAARIRIVIAEKGLEGTIAYETVDLIAAEQKRPSFLAMNPIGKTPVLELDDGLCLSECTAITEYLDNLDGRPVLTGTTPREKAVIHMMQRRVEIMLLEPIDDYFHYGSPGLGPALAPWRKPDWAAKEEWGRRRGQECLANLPWFEDRLAHRAFLAGEAYSMADITLLAAIDFARGIGLASGALSPNLAAWHGRMQALPAVRDRSGRELLPEDISRRAVPS
jgi:glutathione S-transferase